MHYVYPKVPNLVLKEAKQLVSCFQHTSIYLQLSDYLPETGQDLEWKKESALAWGWTGKHGYSG